MQNRISPSPRLSRSCVRLRVWAACVRAPPPHRLIVLALIIVLQVIVVLQQTYPVRVRSLLLHTGSSYSYCYLIRTKSSNTADMFSACVRAPTHTCSPGISTCCGGTGSAAAAPDASSVRFRSSSNLRRISSIRSRNIRSNIRNSSSKAPELPHPTRPL